VRTWLWAWERPSDLRFLEGRADVGVAYLARTLTVDGARVHDHPRRQPLMVHPRTPLTTVVRIEVPVGVGPAPASLDRVVALARAAVVAAGTARLQVDFDARASEIPYYRALLARLRQGLPEGTWLGMTALAAWCTSPRSWLVDPPDVDGIAPMVFALGGDAGRTRASLAIAGGFAVDVCRTDFGISTREAVAVPSEARVLHVFSPDPWTRPAFELVATRWP